MKKYKNKITAGIIIVISLVFVFWYGGNAPGLRGWKAPQRISEDSVKEEVINKNELSEEAEGNQSAVEDEAEEKKEETAVKASNTEASIENKPRKPDNTPMSPVEKEQLAKQIANMNNSPGGANGDKAYSQENGMIIDESTGKDKYLTDPVPFGKPLPVEPQDALITDKELTCTLSVRCDTILEHMAWLDKEKIDIVPENGIIFDEKTVVFYEGESVFNILLREMKRNKIHMEFENTPIYNSAYIEGIANLYEFDCGELSGWMYKVNDWFPNYGCSRYRLKEGDRVEWVYTCDLGIDVGGYYAARKN